MSICSSSSFWIPGLYLISHSGRNFLEFYCFVVDFLGVFLDLRGPEELAGILWRQMAVQCEVARLFKQIMLYKSQMAVSSLSYFILPKPTNVCCECPFFSSFFSRVLSHDHLDTPNGPDFTLNYVGMVSQPLPSRVVISHRWAGRIDTGGHFAEDFVFLLLRQDLELPQFPIDYTSI